MMKDGVRIEHSGATVVIGLTGRLGAGEEDALASFLVGQVQAANGPILLDMANVEFISSSGLRAIMLAYDHAFSMGKRMAMAQVQLGAGKIFRLTETEGNFHIFESKDEALVWLNADTRQTSGAGAGEK